jgi:hypothetical protein
MHIPFGQTFVARHVVFNEFLFPFAQCQATQSSSAEASSPVPLPTPLVL